MAKENKIKESPEAIRRKKEEEKQKKINETLQKKKANADKQRIKNKISFPFSFLFQLSLIIGIITFLVKYFGTYSDLIKSLYLGFIVFTAIYLGIGALILLIVYLIGENKKREYAEKRNLANNANIKNAVLTDEELKEADFKRMEELRKFKETQEQASKSNKPISEPS